jgi:beta-glucosidase
MSSPDPDRLAFPPGFLWGTATAAHQVEGDNTRSDWWEWEQTPGRIRDGSSSGAACDQWRRYDSDFDLARGLWQNAHRFSVEWSRIEPAEGVFDAGALDHYRRVLVALRERGLEPLVTLHHFTNPLWLSRIGGWLNPQAPERFRRFVGEVVGALGDLVTWWATINEPVGYAYQSYLLGDWPPGRRSPVLAWRVLAAMARGHALAYREIHQRRPDARVGIVTYMRVFDPSRPRHPLDRAYAWLPDWVANRAYFSCLRDGRMRPPLGFFGRMRAAVDSQDYLGVNYYGRDMIEFDSRRPRTGFFHHFQPPGAELSLPGWGEVYPEGLYRLLMRLKPLGKPMLITENGIPDNSDAQRPRFLLTHLAALHRAMRDGAPVLGYFHWSLIDNFEWAEGYGARFGLVSVDPKSQERRVKRSGELYAEICRAGAITRDMVVRYAPEALPAVFPEQR